MKREKAVYRKWHWLDVSISRDTDKYVRSLSQRCGVSPGKVISLIVTMELDRLHNADEASEANDPETDDSIED